MPNKKATCPCPHCQAGGLAVLTLDLPLLDWAYKSPEIAGRPRSWRHRWDRDDW